MDSSSDESFSWKKASSGSDDSDDDKVNAKKVTPKKHTQQDIKVNSESLNKLKAKKRKVKNESHETEEIHGPKKKRIKTECGSDSEAVKNKSVKKSDITRESETIEDYDFLNSQVKQEKKHCFKKLNDEKLVKSKKKSKASESIDNDVIESKQNSKMKTENKSKKNKQVCSQENSIISNIIENDSILNGKGVHTDTYTEETRQKSPKKKRSKIKSFTEQNVIDNEHEGSSLQKTEILADSDTGEVIKKSLKKNKSKEKTLSQTNEFDNFDVEDKFTAEETVVEERSKRVTITEKSDLKTNEVVEYQTRRDSEKNLEFSEIHSYSEEYQSPKSEHNDVCSATPRNPSISSGITQRTPRLSDRIRFEGETDSDKDIAIENASSSLLKKILAQNENLQPVSLQKYTEITDDDEIWIFKCPHDVDINKLNNLNLDGKCKIKISGETYCGVLEDRYPINIVTSIKQEKKIKRKMPNDIIHLKKRLPKPHFPEDNVMVNNETDFIPLPEAKCRHPLFGSNYKDYVNIPARSLNSLSEAFDSFTSCARKKKKKHKKERQLETEIQTTIKMDPEVYSIKVPKTEPDSDVPIKKHKKRKHSDNEEYTRKKSKRIKLELNSADAWESEKAIEENLFNF